MTNSPATVLRRSKSEGHALSRRARRVDDGAPSSSLSGNVTSAGNDTCLHQWNALAERETRAWYGAAPTNVLSVDNHRTVVDWCYNVVDCLVVEREVVSVVLAFLHRCAPPQEDSDGWQAECWLAVLACLQLALKLHSGTTALAPRLHRLRLICRRSERQVAQEELRVCTRLRWYLHPPTPAAYLAVATPLVEAIAAAEGVAASDVLRLSRFLVELSCYDPRLALEEAAAVAHAAIAVVLGHLGPSPRVTSRWRALALRRPARGADRCVPRLRRLLAAHCDCTSPCASPVNVGGDTA